MQKVKKGWKFGHGRPAPLFGQCRKENIFLWEVFPMAIVWWGSTIYDIQYHSNQDTLVINTFRSNKLLLCNRLFSSVQCHQKPSETIQQAGLRNISTRFSHLNSGRPPPSLQEFCTCLQSGLGSISVWADNRKVSAKSRCPNYPAKQSSLDVQLFLKPTVQKQFNFGQRFAVKMLITTER